MKPLIIAALIIASLAGLVYLAVKEHKAEQEEYAMLLARARTFSDSLAVETLFEARRAKRAAAAAAGLAASSSGMRGSVR